MSSACSLTGWSGDATSDKKYQPEYKEQHRVLTSSQLGFLDSSYTHVTSYIAAVDFKDYDADEVAHHEANKSVVRAYQVTLDYPGDHGGFDTGYRQQNIVEPREVQGSKKHPGNVKLTHETGDTNGDGWISGDDAECGLASGIGFFGEIPASAFFQDKSVCIGGPASVGQFTTGTTEGAGGAHVTFKENEAEEKVYKTHSAFDKLPFSARVDLMNSVNSATDIRQENGKEVVTATVTAVRVGNQTYSPDGVKIDIVLGTGTSRVKQGSTGMQITAAWLADRLSEQQNAPTVNQIDASVTINGGVTLTLADVLSSLSKSGATTPTPTKTIISQLKSFANGAQDPTDHL